LNAATATALLIARDEGIARDQEAFTFDVGNGSP
jgi:hypothetical protein